MSEQFDKLYDDFFYLHWYSKYQRIIDGYYEKSIFDLPDDERQLLKQYCYSNMIACLPCYDTFMQFINVDYLLHDKKICERGQQLSDMCHDYNLKCSEELCYHMFPYMGTNERTAIMLHAQILLYESKSCLIAIQ